MHYKYVENFFVIVPMQKLCKSVKICPSYYQRQTVTFFLWTKMYYRDIIQIPLYSRTLKTATEQAITSP